MTMQSVLEQQGPATSHRKRQGIRPEFRWRGHVLKKWTNGVQRLEKRLSMRLLHPAVDVVTGVDLALMDVWRVAESLQLLRDPIGPVAVAGCVGDEDVGHGLSALAAVRHIARRGSWAVVWPVQDNGCGWF